MTPLVDHIAAGRLYGDHETAAVALGRLEPAGGRDMTSADLGTRYRLYLDALNERRLDDLVHYVQDDLSYNGETMTRRQYQDLIATDITAIPDLTFDAQSSLPATIMWHAASSSIARRSTNFWGSHRMANGSALPSTSSITSATAASQRYGL